MHNTHKKLFYLLYYSWLQYSCLQHPMDRGAWRATVHGVARVGHDLATKPTPLLLPQKTSTSWGEVASTALTETPWSWGLGAHHEDSCRYLIIRTWLWESWEVTEGLVMGANGIGLRWQLDSAAAVWGVASRGRRAETGAWWQVAGGVQVSLVVPWVDPRSLE